MKTNDGPRSAGHNLTISGERLWDTLMETAQIGATKKGGINRLTLTDLDRQVRDWFRRETGKLGCTVSVDDMGVVYARRLIPARLASGRLAALLPAASALAIVAVGGVLTARAIPGVV